MKDQTQNFDVINIHMCCTTNIQALMLKSSATGRSAEPHHLKLSSVVGFRRVVYQDGFYGAEIYVSTFLLSGLFR